MTTPARPAQGEDRAFPLLMVEDDPDVVFLFKRSLAKAGLIEGFRVARDGEEAVHYLGGTGPFHDRGRHPLPCLVLLDLRLPRVSGLEVLEWVRSRPALAPIPIFVLTTSDLPEDERRAHDLGARAYWVKPVDLKGLERVARKVVRYVRMYSGRVRGMLEKRAG